MKQRKNR